MKSRLPAIAGALVLISASVMSGCGTETSATQPAASANTAPEATQAAYPLTIDNCGFDVTITQAPQRVVTIKSSTAEMMLALGVGGRIVGAAYLDGPIPDSLAETAATVPALTNPLSDKVPGAEATLELEPDLIFAGWESNVSAEGVGERSQLATLGVNSYVSPSACKAPDYQPNPLTFEDIWQEIEQAGAIFDAVPEAATLIEQEQRELAAVTPDSRGLTALWWSSGTDTPYVGAGIGAPQLIMASAGLTNVAADTRDTWASMSWEAIAAADPDVIVLVDSEWNSAQKKADFLASNPVTRELSAVKNSRYAVIPFAATEAGVRTVDAVADLAAQLSGIQER